MGNVFPAPARSFWIIAGLLVVALFGGMAVNSIRTAAGRMPWSHMTAETTLLPSNTAYTILPMGSMALSDAILPSGSMALGTDRGLVLWTPPAATDLPDRWTIFTTGNSGLPHNSVLALAQDETGSLGADTASGLGRYDGTTWRAYRASDFGLPGDRVNALVVDSAGRVWLGANAGAAVFDGKAINVTLAMAISGMLRGSLDLWANLAALAVAMSLPVVILFLVLQRYLIDRLLIGRPDA